MRVLAPEPTSQVEPLEAAPTFSVVMPVYEGAATIAEALESILAQDPPALELIVSDDGSTDALDAALAPFLDRIVLVRNPHRGVAAARNAGWCACRGDFVLFADSDDLLLPGKLAALARLGQERPDLDLLCTDMCFERDGQPAGRFGEINPFPIERQRETILERCFLVQPAFRRSRLADVGGFDESLATGEDWDCVLRLILDGSAAGLCDEPLAIYRIRSGSLTNSRPQTLRDRVRILEKARSHPSLRDEERQALKRSIASQRARARLAAAQAALLERRPDARRRCLALAITRNLPPRLRIWGFAVAVLPPRLQRPLAGRRAAPSELIRSLPSDARPRT